MSPLNDKVTPLPHIQENDVELLDDIEDEILVLQELEEFDPTNEEYNKMKLREFKGILKKRYSQCVDEYVPLMAIRGEPLNQKECQMIMKNLYPAPMMLSLKMPPVTPKKKNYQDEFEKIYVKLLNLKAFICYQAMKTHGYLLKVKHEAQKDFNNSEFKLRTNLDLLD